MKSRVPAVMGWFATLLVVGTLILAFSVVGSPLQARKEDADENRETDLGAIARRVHNYYGREKKLPNELKTIPNDAYSGESQFDPVTRRSYEYNKLSPTSYEICVDFETDTTGDPVIHRSYNSKFRKHPKGRLCFRLEARDSVD